MTEHRLKELLDDLAADGPEVDTGQIDIAWRTARQRRRRNIVPAAAGVTVVLVAGAASLVQIQLPNESIEQPLGTDSPSPSVSVSQSPAASAVPEAPDARYNGVSVWWAPPARAEAQLDWLESAIPRSIDLAAGQPGFQPGEPARGVFAVLDANTARPLRLIVLTASGATRELPAEHIEANRDQDGNTGALMPPNGGLSPVGRHLAISQPSSLELYDLISGSWTTIDTKDWLAEGARWLDKETIWVPDQLGDDTGGTAYDVEGEPVDVSDTSVEPDLAVTPDDQPYGPWVDAPNARARSYFLHGPVRGGRYTNPEGVIARMGDTTAVLAIDIHGRSKVCCPVVGWLPNHTVAFESNDRVLAWKPGSGVVHHVAEFTGLADGKEAKWSSWAWRALTN